MRCSSKTWCVGLVLLTIFLPPVSSSEAGTFYDKFDDNFLNPIWGYEIWGQGPTLAEVNHRLEITFPASSTGDFLGFWIVPQFFTAGKFGIKGDFDEQVDFNLLNWPAGNGIAFTMSGPMQFHIGRTSWPDQPGGWREVYYVWCLGSAIAWVETTDTLGKLRLKRTGNTMEGFYWRNNAWQLLGSHTSSLFGEQDGVGFSAGGNGQTFLGQLVKIGCNNYQLTNQYICNALAPQWLLQE
jgi:hypothetical protein